MNEKIQKVINLLESHDIVFKMVEHNPVYTIEEVKKLHLPHSDAIAKNLFVRDDKKRHYYLLVVNENKRVHLKSLEKKIHSRRLSFASENDLNHILKLTKGSVTPFGVINDEDKIVEMIIDESFQNHDIGIHPNDNSATVWLKTSDLVAVLQPYAHSITYVHFDDNTE